MRVLDLFCGIGGFSNGFDREGFHVVGADKSVEVGATFKLNITGEFILTDLSQNYLGGTYDVIIGGPPCKPWSSVNLTRRGKKHNDYKLLAGFFEHVEDHLPTCFILENVPPLGGDKKLRHYLDRMQSRYGYQTEKRVVRYSDFGAPTSRHRLIVFGVKGANPRKFFTALKTYHTPQKSVKTVIWKLRKLKRGGRTDHVWPDLKTIEKYRDYYASNKFGWYVLDWMKPAPSFGNVMKTYILHPDSFNGGMTRVISVKEASLIMGFENSFQFAKNLGMGLKYQMISDAVSPAFSVAAAKATKSVIKGETVS